MNIYKYYVIHIQKLLKLSGLINTILISLFTIYSKYISTGSKRHLYALTYFINHSKT